MEVRYIIRVKEGSILVYDLVFRPILKFGLYRTDNDGEWR